jgi:CRP-like cAMP-binding protein
MDVSSFFNYPNRAGDDYADSLVFLPNLDDTEWRTLLSYTETVRFRAGESVLYLGEIDRALYIITAGHLEVLVPQGLQGLRVFATVEPGSVVGEQSFFDGKPRSAMVRSVSDGEMLRLSFDSFEALSARAPTLARDLLLDLGRILAIRLRLTTAVAASRTS